MKKQELLKQHKYAIKYNENDRRWHTYVPDTNKPNGRRPVAKRNRDDLDDYLVAFYKELQEQPIKQTFKLAFELSLEEKLKYVKNETAMMSRQNTITKNRTEYNRFIAGTDFENKTMASITKQDIESLCLYNLKRYDLKKKAFNSLKGLIKQAFDYAYNEYWILDNVYSRVKFTPFYDLVVPSTPVEERVHSEEEVKAILNELHQREKETPEKSKIWALEMQLLLGSRRGEIPPFEWSDLYDTHIHIGKEQLYSQGTYATADHTKTKQDRDFPITNDLDDFLKRLKSRNEKYYPNSKLLFPQGNENIPVTGNSVYKVYSSICKKLGIKIEKDVIKGPHSFRRNSITDFVNNTNGNSILAAKLFGNSPEVIMKNYFTSVDLETAKQTLNQRKLIS